ncbi:DUF1707 domain-containing protein [Streptomyces thermolineatus]|uniref:DUF1707 domain-containing protein n=1 Tax=Streptomyces thermolineatus TaxID=44033 RepID=A0ABP5Z944_9ACTN
MDDSPLEKRQPDRGPVREPAREPVRREQPARPPGLPFAEPESGPESGPGLRASDADRDRVADILREALAEGRLDAEEHSERIDRLYRSRTVGELEPLVRDLPVPSRPAAPARPAPEAARATAWQVADDGPADGAGDTLVAVFGGATRRGRWRARRRITAFALFGGVEIDLTEAVFEAREVEIRAVALFGGVEIKAPEGITLRDGGGAGIFGGFEIRALDSDDPGAPVVTVSGLAAFGAVEAKRKRTKRGKELGR